MNNTAVMSFAKAILHGDDEHRNWLLEAARAFEAGEGLPVPRGSGAEEWKQRALRAEKELAEVNERLREQLMQSLADQAQELDLGY